MKSYTCTIPVLVSTKRNVCMTPFLIDNLNVCLQTVWEFDLTSDVFVMQISHIFACHHYITPEKSFHRVH